MKVIIAGSRGITSYSVVEAAVAASGFPVTEVVSGGARGVDELGEWYATQRGFPIKRFPANWGQFGRAAGPVRNETMAKYADALVAVWDGESRGTADMINKAKLRNLKIHVKII
jgi:hypothetical protein